MVDVNEGRRLLAEATKGPWEYFPNTGPYLQWIQGRTGVEGAVGWEAVRDVFTLTEEYETSGFEEADADLIVWLRNNAAALLDAVEKVEAARALHQPSGRWYNENGLSLTRPYGGEKPGDPGTYQVCRGCNAHVPCETIRALDGSGVPE